MYAVRTAGGSPVRGHSSGAWRLKRGILGGGCALQRHPGSCVAGASSRVLQRVLGTFVLVYESRS